MRKYNSAGYSFFWSLYCKLFPTACWMLGLAMGISAAVCCFDSALSAFSDCRFIGFHREIYILSAVCFLLTAIWIRSLQCFFLTALYMFLRAFLFACTTMLILLYFQNPDLIRLCISCSFLLVIELFVFSYAGEIKTIGYFLLCSLAILAAAVFSSDHPVLRIFKF